MRFVDQDGVGQLVEVGETLPEGPFQRVELRYIDLQAMLQLDPLELDDLVQALRKVLAA